MSDARSRGREQLSEPAPPALLEVCAALSRAGYSAFVVGAGLRELLRGSRPSHFEVATDAPPDALAGLYPTAVLIDARHGTVMVPTPSGPVDVGSLRDRASIEDELSHRDFTVNALAYEAESERLLDPFGGRKHLEERLLCAVGSARDRLLEDPLRALRGIRLAATLGWRLDAELEAELGTARGELGRVPCEAVRRELVAILLAESVGQAFEHLEHSGLAAELAPGAAPHAGPLLARLPFDVELRLAAWLRGSRARRSLQKLRFSRPSVDRVEQLLRLHPLDVTLETASRAATSRLRRKTAARDLGALIALRKAELEVHPAAQPATAGGLQRLDQLAEELRSPAEAAERRDALAIGGDEVMRMLDCRPGPLVGRALAYLRARIAADPSLNSPAALTELLAGWRAAEPATGQRSSRGGLAPRDRS